MLNKDMLYIAHAACKISRVTNIQTATLNGAIHSEIACHESRDSFHSHLTMPQQRPDDGRRPCISACGFKPSRKKCRRPVSVNSR